MENIEFYWDLTGGITKLLSVSVEGLLFCRFVKPFMKENKYVYGIWFPYFITMAVLYFIPMEVRYPYIAGLFVFACCMYIVDRRNIEQKLFLVIILFHLQWISGMSLAFRDVLFHLFINAPYMAGRQLLQLCTYGVVECLYYLLSNIILYVLICIIHKVYVFKKENLTKKEFVLLFIPFISLFLGRVLFGVFSDFYEHDLGNYVWNMHEEFKSLQYLYQFISIPVIIIVTAVYQSIKENQQKEKEMFILEEQMENIKRHIGEVEKLYSDIRGLKHDMANHVMVLEALFMKDERQELEQYFLQLKEKLKETAKVVRSGNPVTDIILTEKQKEAAEKGIEFQCDFYYTDAMKMDVFDVSIILNNALANAVCASEGCESPYIHIRSYCKKNAFIIEVKNRFAGELSWNEESGLPQTSKEDTKNHGYGLSNIRRVAQKYYGDIEIIQENGEFCLSILLMKPLL